MSEARLARSDEPSGQDILGNDGAALPQFIFSAHVKYGECRGKLA
jgi:hypothetical protein